MKFPVLSSRYASVEYPELTWTLEKLNGLLEDLKDKRPAIYGDWTIRDYVEKLIDMELIRPI